MLMTHMQGVHVSIILKTLVLVAKDLSWFAMTVLG